MKICLLSSIFFSLFLSTKSMAATEASDDTLVNAMIDSSVTHDPDYMNLKKAADAADAALKQAQKDLDDSKTARGTFQQQLAAAKSDIHIDPNMSSEDISTALDKAKAKITALDAQVKRADQDVDAAQATFDSASLASSESQNNLSGGSAQIKTTKQKWAASKITTMQKNILKLNVQEKLSKAKIKSLDRQSQLQLLERSLDDKMIGNYVQTKLQKVMDSPQFCAASKSCSSGTAGKTNLNSLFSGKAEDKAFVEEPSSGSH